ncbi:MAG: thermonuclease family protein [Candidatus Binataceae bacterium]
MKPRVLGLLRWVLIPRGCKVPENSRKPINARVRQGVSGLSPGSCSVRAMCDRRISIAIVIAVITFLGSASAPAANELTGMARVIDGDTIALGQLHIRLEGIDAPETDQVCLDAEGKPWTCGVAARNSLSSHIAGRIISCIAHGEDRYGRMLAICSADGEDLNAFMVREGLALDYVKYSREYISAEDTAREQRRGMWAGAFIAPWDWRHRDRNTVILGALSVPVTAQTELLAPASSTTAPSPECTIKGNVNRKGERIYHMPGQIAYAKVDMRDPQKRWFCSEDEARAAGWRPAMR